MAWLDDLTNVLNVLGSVGRAVPAVVSLAEDEMPVGDGINKKALAKGLIATALGVARGLSNNRIPKNAGAAVELIADGAIDLLVEFRNLKKKRGQQLADRPQAPVSQTPEGVPPAWVEALKRETARTQNPTRPQQERPRYAVTSEPPDLVDRPLNPATGKPV